MNLLLLAPVMAATMCAPTTAQSLDPNDYAAIFSERSDEVLSLDDGTRVLVLPGEVTLTAVAQDGRTDHFGTDKSGKGAVLCLATIWAAMEAVSRACPAQVEINRATVATGRAMLVSFVARNAFPPLTEADMDVRYEAYVDAYAGAVDECTLDEDLIGMFDALTAPGWEDGFERTLETSRLPVMNPCL